MRNRISDLPGGRQEYFGYKQDKLPVQAKGRKIKIKYTITVPFGMNQNINRQA